MISEFSARWLRFALLLGFVLQLQAADLQFDVASVKPNHSGSGHSDTRGNGRVGSLTLENVTLTACISSAYTVKPWQIVAPEWLSSERYDISAKAGRPLQPGEMNQMLQTLLAERFHLAIHRDKRTLRGYELITTPTPKLQPATDDGSSSLNSNNGHYVAQYLTMAEFADALAGEITAPVRDKTGLVGRFNFAFNFSSDLSLSSDRTNVLDGPSIFTALEKQLGLKLEAVRAPFEVIVVDHADKLPTEN